MILAQEHRRRPVVGNKFNPFRPDKMMPPGMFCGRIDELRFIDHCLMQTKKSNPQHFLLEGERGIGKSSLFLCGQYVAEGRVLIPETRDEKLDFIVVNVSLLETDDYYTITRKIMAAFRVELMKRQTFKAFASAAWDLITRFEGGGFRYDRESTKPEQAELLGCLQTDFVAAASAMDGVADGILLLIDEADKPPVGGNLGLICKMLTEELSRRGCERVCIGLAGLPQIIGVLRESHESSLRIFKTMELKPLEKGECEQVLDIGLSNATESNGFDISITDEARKYISDLSEGYPHFLQEFAYCAFEEDNDNTIDSKDVVKSLFREHGSFDQLGRKYFAQYYDAPSSDDYRKVLDTMAAHGNDWVGRAELIKESGLKAGTVDNALRALKTKNIIVQHEAKQGQYRLPTKSFAVWIKAKNKAERASQDEGAPGLFEPTGNGG
jgi:hypothetical protein